MKEERAWLTFLSTDNYYLYMLLGLYKCLKDLNTIYPFYCAITKDISKKTKNILNTIGIKTIELDTSSVINKANEKLLINVQTRNDVRIHYYKAFGKLALFDMPMNNYFDKVVYLDTDIRFFENVDFLFEYEHMSAIPDMGPYVIKIGYPYMPGDSKFCSGLLVWDYQSHPNEGHKIIEILPRLNPDVAWHDQAVLNYYFRNWERCTQLHIDPKWCMMNFRTNFTVEPNPKGIHYTGRLKDGWPFDKPVFLKWEQEKEQDVGFIEYVQYLKEVVDYYNEKYNFNIPEIHPENIYTTM